MSISVNSNNFFCYCSELVMISLHRQFQLIEILVIKIDNNHRFVTKKIVIDNSVAVK